MQRTIRALAEAKIRDIILVVKFEAEKIKAFFGNGRQLGCEIKYVKQKQLGGTADAVKACEDELQGENRFLIVYGDNYYDKKAIGKFVESSNSDDLLIGVAETKDPSRFGSLEVKRGAVVSIREKVEAGEEAVVNGGIYTLDDSIFPAVRKTRKSRRGEFELTDSLSILIAEKARIKTVPFGSREWMGISYP